MSAGLRAFQPRLAAGALAGLESEVFIYETQKSCLGWFVYPNRNEQQGIGLHLHRTCDDVEIVMSGTGYRFLPGHRLEALPTGTVIVNPPSSPHSLVAKAATGEVVVYGYRCPPEFSGEALDWRRPSHLELPRRAVELRPGAMATQAAQGDNAFVCRLRVEGEQTLPAPLWEERTLVVMEGTLRVSQSGRELELGAGDIALASGAETLSLSSEGASVLVLEPLPRSLP